MLVNNASAIYLTGTLDTPIRRFDLMHQVNARGTFLATAARACRTCCAPPTRTSSTSRRRSTSNPRWFAPHLAYTMAKYGMSLCVLGMAEEFRAQGVAVNALWPRTAIDTAAITPDRRRGDPPPAHAQARRSSPTPPTPS